MYKIQLNIIIKYIQLHIMKLALAVVLLITFVTSQIAPASQYNGAYCYRQTADRECLECSFGFYKSGSECLRGQINCKTFDAQRGLCLSCYVGYSLNGQSRCLLDDRVYLYQGCSRVGLNASNENVCLECSSGYYFNYEWNCELVDTLCKVFNYETLRCQECFLGYSFQLNQNRCIASPVKWDSNCLSWQDQTCLVCNNGYDSLNNICVQSNPNCKKYDQNTSKCLQCYDNYQLSNNICSFNPLSFNNYLCASYQNTVCKSCYYKAVLNGLNQCIPVNPLCLTYNLADGRCSSCYVGYVQFNGNCIIESFYLLNPYCLRWTSSGCAACAPWSYPNSNNFCVLVNPLCRSFNNVNGLCLSCYNGYNLNNGSCLSGSGAVDPNCQTFTNGTCSQCYGGYYYKRSTLSCLLNSKNCSNYDGDGNCISCYGGYYVNKGECEIIDPLCANFNQQTKVCQGCYGGYTLTNNKCVITK